MCAAGQELRVPHAPVERGQEVRTRKAVHRWVWGVSVARLTLILWCAVTLAGVDGTLTAVLMDFCGLELSFQRLVC